MKCYFCLTAPLSDDDIYVDLLEVSLKTAKKNTSLRLVALYDGPKVHRCYRLLQEYNVQIIEHVFSHRKFLEKVYPEKYLKEKMGRVIPYEKIAGTFMRLDIPFVETEDEFVLYADIDVYFVDDITLKDFSVQTKYLAAAPEFSKDIQKMDYFNAGVLFLNVRNMRKKCNEIFSLLKKGIPNKSGLFDQGYLNQVCFSDMDILSIEFNWKPYWGINNKAKLIHFHGMKPGGNKTDSGFAMTDEAMFAMLDGHIRGCWRIGLLLYFVF